MQDCRVSSDLRRHELSQELGIKQWVANCPDFRRQAKDFAVKIISEGDSNDHYQAIYEEFDADDLAKARAIVEGRDYGCSDDSLKIIDQFITAASDHAVRMLFGRDENTAAICEDDYSEEVFKSEILVAVMVKLK
jgi:hypothetical protein